MREHAFRIILIFAAVIIGFSILGFLLKALWWIALIAGGMLLASMVMRSISKD